MNMNLMQLFTKYRTTTEPEDSRWDRFTKEHFPIWNSFFNSDTKDEVLPQHPPIQTNTHTLTPNYGIPDICFFASSV